MTMTLIAPAILQRSSSAVQLNLLSRPRCEQSHVVLYGRMHNSNSVRLPAQAVEDRPLRTGHLFTLGLEVAIGEVGRHATVCSCIQVRPTGSPSGCKNAVTDCHANTNEGDRFAFQSSP